MLSPIIRLVVTSKVFTCPFIHATDLDGASTDHIQSESQTYCESPERMYVNVSHSSTGSRLDSLQTKIEMG